MERVSVSWLLVCAALCGAVALMGSRRQAARGESAGLPPTGVAQAAPQPAVRAAPAGAFAVIRGREGFWRIARTRDGVWWFLDPQNRPQFLNGVTTVQPDLRGRDPRGPDFISHDWNGCDDPASLLHWGQCTVQRVRTAGFKSLGAWCNPILHRCDVPMTQDLNVCQWAPYGVLLFSPQWQRGAQASIEGQTRPLRENRNLIGYYIDNELNWDEDAVGPRLFFDQLPPDDPNRREVLAVIRDLWSTLPQFNRDWQTHLADWSQLQQAPRLPEGTRIGYERLATRWLYHVAEAYFRITTGLIRQSDPNHLILGCRYRGFAPAEVVVASRAYTDAQSLNYYAADALLDADTFRSIHEKSGQPLIISEYSFHSLDGRSGDRNLAHFPGQVADQRARAAGYRSMTERLARVPYVIGADWFQWMDEPPSGRRGDGEDVNMGVVDVHDRPYELLVNAVEQTASILDDLHAGSANSHNETVWRRPPSGIRPGQQYAGGASELIGK